MSPEIIAPFEPMELNLTQASKLRKLQLGVEKLRIQSVITISLVSIVPIDQDAGEYINHLVKVLKQ